MAQREEMAYSIKQTPSIKVVKQISGVLRAGGHSAMLAGGYLRDEVMGKPQKDIDVLVKVRRGDWSRVYDLLASLRDIFGFDLEDKSGDYTYTDKYLNEGNMIDRVLGIKFHDKSLLDIDIIIVNVGFYVYLNSRFPTNASKIYSYDGGTAFWGADFEEFRTQGVMRYTGTNFKEDYRTRMRAKYPECTEVMPADWKDSKSLV